jgi:hypothetical protein
MTSSWLTVRQTDCQFAAKKYSERQTIVTATNYSLSRKINCNASPLPRPSSPTEHQQHKEMACQKNSVEITIKEEFF